MRPGTSERLAQGRGGRGLCLAGLFQPLWAGSLGPAEALALSPAQALRCHVCSSSSNCKKPQVCSASSSFCKTVIRGE